MGENYIFHILEPPAFKKYSIHWVLEALCICICLCMCVFVFVFVFLSICHHQMISFQKIYGLYGLKHNTMEINGDVTMETDRQPTWPRKVKIMLVSKLTKDCWTADFRNNLAPFHPLPFILLFLVFFLPFWYMK